MTTWIEPPPPQRGMGCFAKGCLILIAFLIFLGLAAIGGVYFGVRYVRSTYFPPTQVQLPAAAATEEKQQEVRTRWDSFEKAARAHEPARIEMTAEDLNALIASEPKLRGKAYVSIEDKVGHLQVSIPLETARLLKGHYINAECTVQSAVSGDPADVRITSIVINGQPVDEEALRWLEAYRWLFGSFSLRRYMSHWAEENNLKTFEIREGKVILESQGVEEARTSD